MNGLFKDLLVACRSLWKKPGLALVVILTLGLGIGANSAVFSVVNAVLLFPLPLGAPEQLVAIYQTIPERNVDRAPTSPRNFLDWQQRNQVFAGMAAYVPAVYGLVSDGPPEQVWGAEVSAELFSVLQVTAWRGRTLLAKDGAADAEPVVVISQGLWQRVFGADPAILGQLVRLDDRQYRVVGIMPAGFSFVERAEVWTPLIFTPQDLAHRGRLFLETVARLAPGQTLARARAEMTALTAAMAEEDRGNPQAFGIRLIPLQQATAGDLRSALLLLLAVVAFVLLVACANVANLLLARGVERQGEMALRAALGANRGRIVRQLLGENLVIAVLGGAAGLLLATGLTALIQAAPSDVPRLAAAQIDGRVLLFTLAISLLTGGVFGLLPALYAARPNLSQLIQGGSNPVVGGSGGNLLRNLLVTGEVALALVVLINAGLLVRSLERAQMLAPGFAPDRVLALSLIEPDGKFQADDERLVFYQRLLEQLTRLPRVQAVGASTSLPLAEGQRSRTSFIPEGLHLPPGEPPPFAAVDGVTPDFFRALGLPLLQGRPFTPADLEAGPLVAIVDRRLADTFWPGEDPLGKRVTIPGRGNQPHQVIGVVGSIGLPGLGVSPDPQIYLPLQAAVARRISFVLRVQDDPDPLAVAARSAIWDVDRTQAIAVVATLADLLADALANRRWVTQMVGLFALAALLLAVLGIHGVTTWSVSQRIREIGIRRALGASRQQILRWLVAQGMRWTLLGLVLGLAGALALTRLLASLLLDVGSTDAWAFSAVSLTFLLVALVATLIPAWRGIGVDPIAALRNG